MAKYALQPLMSTLILGGKTADQYCPEQGSWHGIEWAPHPNMPPRRAVSIEEFERDMREAGIRK
jgi:hypothetical protein